MLWQVLHEQEWISCSAFVLGPHRYIHCLRLLYRWRLFIHEFFMHETGSAWAPWVHSNPPKASECLIWWKNTSSFPWETRSHFFHLSESILKLTEAVNTCTVPLQASESPVEGTGAQLQPPLEGKRGRKLWIWLSVIFIISKETENLSLADSKAPPVSCKAGKGRGGGIVGTKEQQSWLES